MRRIYQREWHGIRFAPHWRLSAENLAGPLFYEEFYKAFFSRYQEWEELALQWRREKEDWADFITARAPTGSRILAVGCGLGFLEHRILGTRPDLELTVHEIAPSAWNWIKDEFDPDHRLIGLLPACLPTGREFDLVYLATVDYALEDSELIGILSAIKNHLARTGGECLLISASLESPAISLAGQARLLLRKAREFATIMAERVGMGSRTQFWGWSRTRQEYQSLMKHAGYTTVVDGYVNQEAEQYYWVAGYLT